MKKFKRWVKGLSLSQQLFTIIFTFITFFIFFFFVYLSGKIDFYIKKQMFTAIDTSQSSVAFMYDKNFTTKQLLDMKDENFIQIFYDEDGTLTFSRYTSLEKDRNFIRTIKYNVQHPELMKEYEYEGEEFATYYRILPLDEKITLITLLDNDYRNQYKDTLLSTIINITVIVVGIFFIILMVWMAYLIHPLNQIRNYIEKIKIGEDAELKVNRRDEIGELADALVSMREELRKQEKTKEEMIHNISHDLKTPIATIKSYGESIKDGIYPYDTLEKSVDVIIDNAERLEKKVHSLLFLNRVEYLIAQEKNNSTTSMKKVIEDVILAIKVIKPNIEIDVDIKENVIFNGSEEPWRITVENIVDNALRYAKSKILITLEDDELSIYNDGPCMSDERLKTLFKPFEKGQGGQFGLGLSIVYKVVTANHYKVTGENTSDGVVFRISKN